MASSAPFRTATVSLSLLAAATLGADEPYLVRDIDPGPGSEVGSGAAPIRVGDRVFLFVADDQHGSELWVTDGTAAGSRLVRDICPGVCPSAPVVQGSLGGLLLFSAAATATGPHRMWASNGTWEGTRPLGSGPILGQSAVGGLTDRGLFLFAAEHDDRTGLWVTDGTRGGTRPLGLGAAEGWPDPVLPGDPDGRGALVFGGFTPGSGVVPWVTDGTDTGTRPLFTRETAEAQQQLQHIQRLPAGTVFFTRFVDGPCRTTLWVSDGTLPGTRPIRAFDEPECFDVVDSPVLAAGDAIYFVVRDRVQPPQLWRSDGTAPGTRPMTSFPHDAFTGSSSFSKAATDEALLFVADDGVSGFEPWLADAGGVRRIADLCPGACSSHPREIAVLGGRFYFTADDGEHGGEPWTSDGTAAGTRRIADACPGDCSSFPAAHALAGGLVYFTADHSEASFERELWAAPTDGGGAVRLTDLAPDSPFGSPGLLASAQIDGDLLFAADDGAHGSELWRTDGTPGGTRMVADLATAPLAGAGSEPVRTLPWQDRVFFFAHEPGVGYQPWVSDGTEEGTRRLGVVTSSHGFHVQYSKPLVLGDEVLFVASAHSGGPLELWRTAGDGAPVRLTELTADGPPAVSDFARLGDRVVAFVQRSTFDQGQGGIWVSDGTAAGTRRLGGIATASFAYAGSTGDLNGKLYFSGAAAPSEDFELWSTDGTDAGTALVANLASGTTASYPGEFVRLGNRLLFAADTAAAGRELWTTDGTAAGTRMVADLVPGSTGSFPRYLSAIGDRVVFVARNELGSNDFWASDGTAAGTTRLSVFPGEVFDPSLSSFHAVANGRLFLVFQRHEPLPPSIDLWVSDGTAAGTGNLSPLLPANATVASVWPAGDRVRVALRVDRPFTLTHELWETDGTFAGTRRLLSLPGGFGSGAIDQLAQVGSLLYFRGPHPEAGSELMALPLGPPAPCAAGSETICLRDGRFAVRARWRDPRSGDQGTAGALPMPGSDRTGLFWFFQPDNVELVFKTLDGGGVNGFFWNFYGALSDVEYTIEVTDTATGRRTEYFNPGGEICGRGDTTAFPARPPVPLPVPPPSVATVRSAAAAGAGGTDCGGDPGDLCLFGERFRVEVEWTDQRSGDIGVGTAIPFADRSGFFWFFEPQNVELVVKVLDGRDVNGRFWVFYGGLSDVEYTITVTDTETDQQAVYRNPPGEICGRGDTTAF